MSNCQRDDFAGKSNHPASVQQGRVILCSSVMLGCEAAFMLRDEPLDSETPANTRVHIKLILGASFGNLRRNHNTLKISWLAPRKFT